jgi:hypothetical protein
MTKMKLELAQSARTHQAKPFIGCQSRFNLASRRLFVQYLSPLQPSHGILHFDCFCSVLHSRYHPYSTCSHGQVHRASIVRSIIHLQLLQCQDLPHGIIVLYLYIPKALVTMLVPSPRLPHASAFLKKLVASPLLPTKARPRRVYRNQPKSFEFAPLVIWLILTLFIGETFNFFQF